MSYKVSELTQELSQNFIDYAMAVNTDRAIPDAASGLKPVARRILYGAYINGRTSNKPYVKSARVVGEIMGALHPHGSSSIYEALIHLTQDWIMRYPLIDFHGNAGNIAGDGPAAERYTETRLGKIAEDGMLSGIKKRNVPFVPNYDETLDEPTSLPAIFPNLLCNPNSGIGLALACSWGCHNLREVAQAIKDFTEGKEPMLPGPDFPTGGEVINGKDFPAIMREGKGSVKIRGRYNIEKNKIIFYEIPYGINTENLLREIGEACEKEDVRGVKEIQDQSGKKGLRIVIECERGENPEKIVEKLFEKTSLQSSFSYNQVGLVNGVPTELNLKDCCSIYVNHNIECLKKEIEWDLNKAQERAHIIDGLLIALENIDDIIALIKNSSNSEAAKESLINKYQMSEEQAKAILAMRLSSLARLEEEKLKQEKKELISNIEIWKNTLSSKEKQVLIILERLDSIVEKYGDDRRTVISNIELRKEEEKQIEELPLLAHVLPNNVFRFTEVNKRIPKAIVTFNTTNRGSVVLFTNMGRTYSFTLMDIEKNKDYSINELVRLLPNEKPLAYEANTSFFNNQYILFLTKQGNLKKSKTTEYNCRVAAKGVQALKLREGDEVVGVFFSSNGEDKIFIAASNKHYVYYNHSEIAAIGRAALGVKAIKLKDNEFVEKCGIVKDGNEEVCGIEIEKLKETSRAIKGNKIDI